MALAFGLACIPLVLLIGLAVDFGFIAQARAQLDLAADSAALTATKTAGAAFIANAGTTQAIAQGENDGTNWFIAQVGLIPNASVIATNVQVTNNGNTFNSTVTYQAEVATFFSGLFGVQFVNLTNASAAQIIANAYVDVTFLLDNSSSMLIASTLAGVSTMETVTLGANTSLLAPNTSITSLIYPHGVGNGPPLACAFACHWDASSHDYYGLARNNNVQLRFDVLKTAVGQSITQMYSAEQLTNITDQFGTTIYTFNSYYGNYINQVYPLPASGAVGYDLTPTGAAQTTVQNFQTPVVSDAADTPFPQAMAALTATSTAAGDGSSINSPRKALIIVTDGIQDWGSRAEVPGYPQTAGGTYSGAEGPINSADCNAIKALGYAVYVIYTTYITQDASGNQLPLVIYNQFLVPYVNSVGSPASYDLAANMQACASSPANYAQASDPAAIEAAMAAMLQSVINSASRLTR